MKNLKKRLSLSYILLFAATSYLGHDFGLLAVITL